MNVYGFVGNSSVSLIDPLGLVSFKLFFDDSNVYNVDFRFGYADRHYGYKIKGMYRYEGEWPAVDWPGPMDRPKIPGWVLANIDFKASGVIAKRSGDSWIRSDVSESFSWKEYFVMSKMKRTQDDTHFVSISDSDGDHVDDSRDFVVCEAIVWETTTYGVLDESSVANVQGLLEYFGFVGPYSGGDGYLLKGPPDGWGQYGYVANATFAGNTQAWGFMYAWRLPRDVNLKLGCPCLDSPSFLDEIPVSMGF